MCVEVAALLGEADLDAIVVIFRAGMVLVSMAELGPLTFICFDGSLVEPPFLLGAQTLIDNQSRFFRVNSAVARKLV